MGGSADDRPTSTPKSLFRPTASLRHRNALAPPRISRHVRPSLRAQSLSSPLMCGSSSEGEVVLRLRIFYLDENENRANQKGEFVWERMAFCVFCGVFIIISSFFPNTSHCSTCPYTFHTLTIEDAHTHCTLGLILFSTQRLSHTLSE